MSFKQILKLEVDIVEILKELFRQKTLQNQQNINEKLFKKLYKLL